MVDLCILRSQGCIKFRRPIANKSTCSILSAHFPQGPPASPTDAPCALPFRREAAKITMRPPQGMVESAVIAFAPDLYGPP